MWKLIPSVAAFVLLTVSSCCAAQQAGAQQPTAANPRIPLALKSDSTPLYGELKQAFLLSQASKLDEAAAGYRRVLEKAIATQDQAAQALAHDGLGAVFYRKADYTAARAEAEQALVLYGVLREAVSEGMVSNLLGGIAHAAGDRASARKYYHQALLCFDSLGMLREKANVLRNLQMEGEPEGAKLLEQALAIALEIGDKDLEAQILQNQGDHFFTEGELAAAQNKYSQAELLYQETANLLHLSYLLTSEGRLQRAHGHPEKALPLYQRGLEIQEKLGDRWGAIQNTRAMAVAYANLHNYAAAASLYEKTVAMAKETGSALLINHELNGLASAYIAIGKDQEAVGILKELIPKLEENLAGFIHSNLGVAYFHLGRLAESMESENKAVEIARAQENWDLLPTALRYRALVEAKLDKQDAALADAQESLRVIEKIRTHLVPNDFMKRGFSESTQEIYRVYIGLLERSGQPARALEIAEEARGRAFLDLLATRDLQLKAESQLQLASLRTSQEQLPTGGIGSANAQGGSPGGILMRGGNPAGASSDSELRSLVSVPPFSLPEVQATASRLNSTVLSYWVASDATYIWVINSSGAVHTAVVEVAQKRIEDLVSSLGPGAGAGAGATTDTENRSGTEPVAGEKQPRKRSHHVGTRGGTILTVGTNNRKKWRELYSLLIEPVEASLPATPGSLLTIEAHGPLLMLPFAALMDKQGRYLLERFNLHYTPAVSLLQFTQKKQQAVKGIPTHYLLVADPAQMPMGPEETALPALPGSRQEVATVARMLHGSEVTLLEGKQATEAQLASAAGHSTVLHIATHGIIRDDQPFESFLAVAGDRVDEKHDGRLTAQKIYNLDLHADLVFLSACRSGAGRVSGDGLVGLTRAFWYAGTPSVIASLWDVADEPTYRLVSDFYRSRLQGAGKSSALRSAQLHLLQQLRAGRVVVHTASTQFTLPDDPMFWAGFVLQGEP